MKIKKNKRNGFSLVELMMIMAALGGVALLVSKLAKNSMNVQSDAMSSTEYFDLIRESQFIISDLNSCKVSLANTTFKGSTIEKAINGIELWTADTSGEKRAEKKFSQNQKIGKLEVKNITLSIPGHLSKEDFPEGTHSTNALLKISVSKTNSNNEATPLKDIQQSVYITFSTDSSGTSTIVNCEKLDSESKEIAKVWCGTLQNPCGIEIISVVAIGKYEKEKFTGIFYPTDANYTARVCPGVVAYQANLKPCNATPSSTAPQPTTP